MRLNERNDAVDGQTRECPDCGLEMGSEAVWFHGDWRHESCIQNRREVQQTIEADRKADDERDWREQPTPEEQSDAERWIADYQEREARSRGESA